MKTVSFERTENAGIPAVIRVGENETPVWIQTAWTEGEFARYIQRNGCGHCCAAMAARLRGVELDPYREYLLCRQLWGEPQNGQDHFQTVAGIVKVLGHLQIPAQCYGVEEGKPEAAAEHILQCLQGGKLVIFVSDPFRNPGNVFSTGYHYVMAVGFDENGKILIANSSENTSAGGVQAVTLETVKNALYQGGTGDMEMTWGEIAVLYKGCTYVVVE